VAAVVARMIVEVFVHLVAGDLDLVRIVRVVTNGALVVVVIVFVIIVAMVVMAMVVVAVVVMAIMVVMLVLVLALIGEGPLLLAGRTLIIGER